jgi:hypothetical protein
MVAAQQATLHAQVDQLQCLVVAQCHLTGVNPLAQEMVRGSLYPISAPPTFFSIYALVCFL